MDKKETIAQHFKEIMLTLGMDLNDDSLQGTPDRVAKMYVDELFYGMQDENYPKITVQSNKFNYNQMLIECDIDVRSVCEHHFVPIIGVAHIAYIPDEKVIGLSKLNRITEHYSRRPQVQERLTEDIKTDIIKAVGTKSVAVTIDAIHYCVKMRGVRHSNCVTRTSALSGHFFEDEKTREEYFNSIPKMNELK